MEMDCEARFSNSWRRALFFVEKRRAKNDDEKLEISFCHAFDSLKHLLPV
jgi:hypothetical protein